ncbi:MAG: zinc-ribbon domain-containing protein [Acetatifactor sp.]|nr:zinc-ribbon domain-containing protein [Acetatifactor sp.]
MALITCPECNREVSDQAKTCPHCGYKLPKTKKELSPLQKKKQVMVIAGVFLAFVVIGAGYFFFSPRTVEWCCYHHISDATCTEPEICSRCGRIWGEPVGHNWQEATCTEPEICITCGSIGREAQGHDWQEATCTEPKTCIACGITEGRSKRHSWRNATCTKPRTCIICGLIDGVKLDHDVQDYFCKMCKEAFVTESDVPNILDITSLRYEINYVGGIDQYMTFTNKLKSIDYITLKLEFLNAVGDVLTDDISGRRTASLQFTGPLDAGKTSSRQYWRACFYNSTFSGRINILEIEIEYSDGTTLVLDEDLAEYAVKDWR